MKSNKAIENFRMFVFRKYFGAIREFSLMQNKKLESMAKVNKYIEVKYKARMLKALKRN